MMTSRAVKLSVGGALGVAVLTVWLFHAVIGSNPRSTFEYLVAKPVPQSVDSIQEGGFRTMDSVFRVLRFNIATPDMRKILDSQGYKPVGQEESQGRDHKEYLQYWEERIAQVTKVEVHFTEDWQTYTLKEGHGQKYIFCNTNTSEAVFAADAH